MDYNKKLSVVFDYLFYSCLCSRYASPQLSIDWMIGRMDSPSSVRVVSFFACIGQKYAEKPSFTTRTPFFPL